MGTCDWLFKMIIFFKKTKRYFNDLPFQNLMAVLETGGKAISGNE